MRPVPNDFWLYVALSLFLSFILGIGFSAMPANEPPVLFPYALWADYLADSRPILIILTFAQFPLYVVLVALSKNRMRMVVSIVVLHAIFAITCAWLYKVI